MTTTGRQSVQYVETRLTCRDRANAGVQEATNTTRLFESRSKLELSSSQPARNTLYAFVLSDLLDKRKSTRSKQDLEVLSQEFKVEIDALDRLTRFVNSPSIDSSSIRPAKGKSEEEGFVATVSIILFHPVVESSLTVLF